MTKNSPRISYHNRYITTINEIAKRYHQLGTVVSEPQINAITEVYQEYQQWSSRRLALIHEWSSLLMSLCLIIRSYEY